MNSNVGNMALEMKTEVITDSEEVLTLAHFYRMKGTDDDWIYGGTVSHYPNGDIDLDDSPDWD